MPIHLAKRRNILTLHFTVLIWGFTGILGELISVSALYLVWYRVLIASISLWIYFTIYGKKYIVSKKKIAQFLGVGLIVGLHWILFFHAIKISTVSVTLVCMSSVTLFTAILEPIFNKTKASISDVIVGVIIIFGIYLIFKFEFEYFWGIVYSLLCALCASIFSIFNSRLVKKDDPTVITFYEMTGAFLGVSALLLITGGYDDRMALNTSDLIYLLILGVGCTAFAYVMGVAVMRELSAFTVALTTNLEPVYGIILALLIFGHKETMSSGFYFGAVIILLAVFLYPYLKSKWSSKAVH